MKHFLLICSIFCSISLNAQNGADSTFALKKFSVQQLKQDLDVLKDSLQLLHPALYRYSSKPSFDSIFQTAYKRVNKPMLLSEFYGVVAPFVSKIGDIHTTVELPDEHHNYLATKGDLFPFDVRIINKEAYIISNNSLDSTIPAGSKIF